MNNSVASTSNSAFSSTKIIVCCLSGKRKSGKDFVALKLAEKIQKWPEKNVKVLISGISYPLKEEFAKLNQLDFVRLKSPDNYKETVRKQMVEFGEKIRNKDPGYFCRIAFNSAISKMNETANMLGINHENKNEKTTITKIQFLIISDCRRLTDLEYFRELARTSTPLLDKKPWLIRVDCATEIRQLRGFKYTQGIDDAETECALDNFNEWDFRLQNDGDLKKLHNELEAIVDCIFQTLI